MEPIQVNATPTKAQIEAGLRQAIIAAGAIAGTLGYAGVAGKLNFAMALIGPAAGLIAFLVGQLHTRSQAQKMVVMAQASPDEVATVKG